MCTVFPDNQGRRATILVVDDDEGVTESFAQMLTVEGYKVRTAGDGETALREVEAIRPDAIIVDLRMPLIDGLAFLRRLRTDQAQRKVPVAVITADYLVDEALTTEVRALGADLHFKPFWQEDLAVLTRSLLGVTH
jgi:DNA-binding response OmpR family regulator